MPTNISPNMNLIVPVTGQEPGPAYANDINTSLYSLIDQHDHSQGKGVLITPSGMSISADLPFNVNNATLLRSVRFSPQVAPISGPSDLSALYTVTNLTFGSDLYFNDGNGGQVPIVVDGVVAGTPGSIAGLVAPANVVYSPLSGTFTFSQAVNTPANMNEGPTTIRQPVLNGFGVTLAPNPSQSANYQLTFPIALPGSQELISLGPSGQITETPIDGTSLVFSGGTLQIGTLPANSVGPTQLQALSVGTSAIQNGAVGDTQLAATTFTTTTFSGGSASATQTPTIVSITVSNPNARPVLIMPSVNITISSNGAADTEAVINLVQNVTVVQQVEFMLDATPTNNSLVVPLTPWIDPSPPTGSTTYHVTVSGITGADTMAWSAGLITAVVLV